MPDHDAQMLDVRLKKKKCEHVLCKLSVCLLLLEIYYTFWDTLKLYYILKSFLTQQVLIKRLLSEIFSLMLKWWNNRITKKMQLELFVYPSIVIVQKNIKKQTSIWSKRKNMLQKLCMQTRRWQAPCMQVLRKGREGKARMSSVSQKSHQKPQGLQSDRNPGRLNFSTF